MYETNIYIYIKKSDIKGAGFGLFAKQDIPRGTKLGVYNGKILNHDKYHKLRDKSYVWQINEDRFVDGHPKYYKYKRNRVMLSMANGVKTPKQRTKINTFAYKYKRQIFYKTLKGVKKGEEILLDYGKYYWI